MGYFIAIKWTISYTCLSQIRFIMLAMWGHRGHDRMVVGFTTTHGFSAYHH